MAILYKSVSGNGGNDNDNDNDNNGELPPSIEDEKEEFILELYNVFPPEFALFLGVFDEILGFNVNSNNPNNWTDMEWRAVGDNFDEIRSIVEIITEVRGYMSSLSPGDFASLIDTINISLDILLGNNPTNWTVANWVTIIDNFEDIKDWAENPWITVWTMYFYGGTPLVNGIPAIHFYNDGGVTGDLFIQTIYVGTFKNITHTNTRTILDYKEAATTTFPVTNALVGSPIANTGFKISVDASQTDKVDLGFISCDGFSYGNWLGLKIKNCKPTVWGNITVEVGDGSYGFSTVAIKDFER